MKKEELSLGDMEGGMNPEIHKYSTEYHKLKGKLRKAKINSSPERIAKIESKAVEAAERCMAAGAFSMDFCAIPIYLEASVRKEYDERVNTLRRKFNMQLLFSEVKKPKVKKED